MKGLTHFNHRDEVRSQRRGDAPPAQLTFYKQRDEVFQGAAKWPGTVTLRSLLGIVATAAASATLMALLGPGPAIIAAMTPQTVRSIKAIVASRDMRLMALLIAMTIPIALSDVYATVHISGRTYVITPLEIKAMGIMAQLNAVAQLAKPSRRARILAALRRIGKALKLKY